jgi:hypothetical protein
MLMYSNVSLHFDKDKCSHPNSGGCISFIVFQLQSIHLGL